jgi:OmpA-OmpF porin, OOP family
MKRAQLIKVLVVLLAAAFMMGCATQRAAMSPVTAVDLNQKIASKELAQKVDAFEVIIDSTESMNDLYRGSTKFNQERSLVRLLSDTIPDLKLTAAVREFGQLSAFGDPTSRILLGPVDYVKSSLGQIIAPFPAGLGLSPLDAALDGATSDLRSQSGQLAVIVFSDGEDMEKFAPVKAAERLKSAYGDRICIYTVHLGAQAGGKKVMQQIADAGQCGFMVTGDSISTPGGMAAFVEKVFLKPYVPEPVPEVKKEEPPPVVQEVVREVKAPAKAAPAVVAAPAPAPVTITLGVLFDTGKSIIKPKYNNEISRVAVYMKEYPKTKAVIEGHTDSVGKAAANVKLSQNRANSVKAYLVDKFKIDASRISAVGYGPNKPIASNKTKDGRQKNRRVQAVIE